jgi:hypothetical protein
MCLILTLPVSYFIAIYQIRVLMSAVCALCAAAATNGYVLNKLYIPDPQRYRCLPMQHYWFTRVITEFGRARYEFGEHPFTNLFSRNKITETMGHTFEIIIAKTYPHKT